MVSILQISDFHIKKSMCKPNENPIIIKFVDFVKNIKPNLGSIILVYNGDVIAPLSRKKPN